MRALALLGSAILAILCALVSPTHAFPPSKRTLAPSEVFTLFTDFATRADDLSYWAFSINSTQSELYSDIIRAVDNMTSISTGFLPKLQGASIPAGPDDNKIGLCYQNFVFDHQTFLQALGTKTTYMAGQLASRDALVSSLGRNKASLDKLAFSVGHATPQPTRGDVLGKIPDLDRSFNSTIGKYISVKG